MQFFTESRFGFIMYLNLDSLIEYLRSVLKFLHLYLKLLYWLLMSYSEVVH